MLDRFNKSFFVEMLTTKYLSILILFIQVHAMGLVIKCGKRKKIRFVAKSVLLKAISENYKASN